MLLYRFFRKIIFKFFFAKSLNVFSRSKILTIALSIDRIAKLFNLSTRVMIFDDSTRVRVIFTKSPNILLTNRVRF